MKKIIVNDDLYLETTKKEDAKPVFDLFCEDKQELKNIFNFVKDNMTFKHQEEHFEKTDDNTSFAIWYKGAICGYACLYDLTDISCSILYYVNSKFRGNGIARETIMALTEYAFSNLRLNKVNFFVNIDNASSIGVIDSIGFRKEGFLIENDFCNNRFHDQFLYSVVKGEWPFIKYNQEVKADKVR